ncbi:MAG: hypothetical protein KAT70_03795 [Thermoplasmata archaeon]|nr:hypothetical protein [Thermoplasmata archaeon]
MVPKASDVDSVIDIAALLDDMSEKRKLYVVVGGGRYARTYIGFGRNLGAEERHLDRVGIEFTRLNADLLRLALADRNLPERIPKTVKGAHALGKNHDLVVMGGTVPGHTTDHVSALLAREVGPNCWSTPPAWMECTPPTPIRIQRPGGWSTSPMQSS